MFERFTDGGRQAAIASETLAKAGGSNAIFPIHLARGVLLHDMHTRLVLLSMDVVAETVEQRLAVVPAPPLEAVPSGAHFADGSKLRFAGLTEIALVGAVDLAETLGHEEVSGAHILAAVAALERGRPTERHLTASGLNARQLRRQLSKLAPGAIPDHFVDRFQTIYGATVPANPDHWRTLQRSLLESLHLRASLGVADWLLLSHDDLDIRFRAVIAAELIGDVSLLLHHASLYLGSANFPNHSVHGSVATALARQGRLDQAWATLTRAADNPDPWAALGNELDRIQCHLAAGDLASARTLLAHFDLASVEDLRGFLELHLILRSEAGQVSTAELRAFQAAREPRFEDPSYPWATAGLDVAVARETLRSGKPKAASKLARKAARLAASSGFEGLEVDALEVETAALAMSGRRRRVEVARRAMENAQSLGRVVQAHRIGRLVSN